ncbi:MAG: hypothetical protein HKN04_10765 [Rhodothermaceae bacterium]|nr:hypothetical protein [Rhodothermaceae bacterium]
MARSLSSHTKDLLIQSFLIVLSVLLALFLDEARSDYKLGRQRDQVVGNVIAELRDNATSLEQVVDYHAVVSGALGDYLDSLAQRGARLTSPAIQVVPSVLDGGIQPPELQRTAWNSAQLSPAYSLIPYETTYELARLYDLQANGVETTWRELAQLFVGLDAYDPARAGPVLHAMQFGFGELHSQERFLLEEAQEALDAVCTQMPVPTCITSGQ